jgi:CubicO group peptidase (beta-lactamase class C family)
LTSGQAGSAATLPPPDLSSRVAQIVQPYLTQGDFPGVSVAVVADGRVVVAQGYGVSNATTGAPVQADTRFDIGSVTKTFTAAAVLQLYQQSLGTSRPLDLDAPISDYLHNTRTFKLPRRWADVTTRELLDMSSGIREVEDGRSWTSQLRSIARSPLRFTPGTASAYSDPNYYLLGQLIEQWTGQDYGNFIQTRILNPLGMSQTQELGGSATVPNQAVGYNAPRHGRWPAARLWNGTSMYAAAGIVSTAQDMGSYMNALLNTTILDGATTRMMWTATPRPHYGAHPAFDDARGLGWDSVVTAGGSPVEVAKAGDVPGFTSQMLLDPSTDTGVFVSFNTSHGGPDPSGTFALQLAEAIKKVAEGGS